MEIHINSVNFRLKDDLKTLIEKKVSKVQKLNSQINDVEVSLKLGSEKKQKNKEVSIKLHSYGKEIFVKKNEENFEKALDRNVESLMKVIRRLKEKVQSH